MAKCTLLKHYGAMSSNNDASSDSKRPADRYAGPFLTTLCGLAIAIVGAALFASVFELWPVVDRGDDDAAKEVGASLFFGIYKDSFPLSTGLILLTIVAGALGAYIHAATSFVTFVGNRTFKSSWGWWYGLRLFIGAALALLLYFAFRGGLVTGQDASEDVNPYGIAALSGLAGLFSKQATDKLKEVFDVFFHTSETEGDDLRADKPEHGRPVLTRLEPSEVKVGEQPEVTLVGQRFEKGAQVLVNDRPRDAGWVSETELKLQLTDADTSTAGSLVIIVRNPEPGSLTCDPQTLKVVAS